ncbi:hypothetical protein [Micromonospora haikouensis]|uniref:hypothetical protein n=1 Tax=Micromonospora haikouensis TaxID=686309 RepID=UPI003D755885
MAEVTALPDAGQCRWCPHGQWSHKRGRGGCRELDCVCDKYQADPAAEQAERERVLTAVAEVCERQAAQARTELAELAPVLEVDPDSPVPGVAGERPDDVDPGEPVAGFEPAQPGDVDLEPAAGPDPALAQAVAVAEALAAERDAARRECDRLQSRLDIIRQERRREHLAHQVATLTAERDEARRERDAAVVQRDQAYERVDELDGELGQVRGALDADVDDDLVVVCGRLRTELGRANARAQGAKTRLDKAIVAGTEAATRVLWRYDAEQCLDCGSRFTTWVDHEHPLVPVTVLVVAREVPGAA